MLSPVILQSRCRRHRSCFIPDQRRAHLIDWLAIDEAALLRLPLLSRRHPDPFERSLTCQAIAGGMVILIPDPLIRQYPVRTGSDCDAFPGWRCRGR